MNPKDFISILQKPQAVTHTQTEGIKSIIKEYPYFQPARAIYLKGLKDQSSIAYNQELKKTAAYTTDRSILFDFITSDVFVQNEVSKFIKNHTENIKEILVDVKDVSVSKSVIVDKSLEQQINDTKGVLDAELFQPKDDDKAEKKENGILDTQEPLQKTMAKNEETLVEEILAVGEPLDFDKGETHSFNEWLKLAQFKPIERIEEGEQLAKEKQLQDLNKKKKNALIDKFISQNPKIKPNKATAPKINLAKAQMIQPESLMTETLARVYVEQKNYKSAIQSYKILSLKYPEKSGFFANQIRAVKQLQEQNNKE